MPPAERSALYLVHQSQYVHHDEKAHAWRTCGLLRSMARPSPKKQTAVAPTFAVTPGRVGATIRYEYDAAAAATAAAAGGVAWRISIGSPKAHGGGGLVL